MYYQLTITLELKQNLRMTEGAFRLSQYIGFAMLKNKDLGMMHTNEEIKPYVYDGLYPMAEKGIYSRGRLYLFHINTPSEVLAQDFVEAIKQTDSPFFNTKQASYEPVYINKQIKRLKTVTPFSITLDNGQPWKKEDGVMLMLDRIQKSIGHKSALIYGKPWEANNWLEDIKLLNHKPVGVDYKCKSKVDRTPCPYEKKKCHRPCDKYDPMRLIGNKLEITLTDHPEAQKAAEIILATGLLEKNGTLGLGYSIIA